MTDLGVVHIARELFGSELPITFEDPFVQSADDLGACVGTVEKGLHIPGHVAQVFSERERISIPVAEDQALVVLDARNSERAPTLLVQRMMVAVLFVRHRNQIAADIVGPAVIRAHEDFARCRDRRGRCASRDGGIDS